MALFTHPDLSVLFIECYVVADLDLSVLALTCKRLRQTIKQTCLWRLQSNAEMLLAATERGDSRLLQDLLGWTPVQDLLIDTSRAILHRAVASDNADCLNFIMEFIDADDKSFFRKDESSLLREIFVIAVKMDS